MRIYTTKDVPRLMYEDDPTFLMAKYVWLHCYKNNLPVPPAVEKKFIETMQQEADDWWENKRDNDEKVYDNDSLNVSIVELFNAGFTFADIAGILNEESPDAIHSRESIKNRYNRLK